MECYLDNSATTKPAEAVIDEISRVLRECWGNPSSLHGKGVAAEMLLRDSREKIAGALSVSPETVYFSPSGTISSGAAILGAAEARKRRGRKIITTGVEHAATLNTFKRLESQGCETVYIKPAFDGTGLAGQIAAEVDDKTALVSFMHVNNELGQIFDIDAVASAVKKKNPETLVHCDAVQSFMKLPISLRNSDIDLMSVSAHKIHGPKGIGALYIKDGVRIVPQSFGGGQEKNIFPGTENTAFAAGFARAVEIAREDIKARLENISGLDAWLRSQLENISGAFVLSPESALPYILSFGLEGIRSEILLHFLEARGVYVSSGSACSKGKKSHVMAAFGVQEKKADCAVRVSMAGTTARAELEFLCEALNDAGRKIRKK